MAKQKILVHKINIDEKADVFLPFYVDIPKNAKRITGLLFTTNFDNSVDNNPLVGRIKMLSDVFFKADIPDFDIFYDTNRKWNKDLLKVDLPIKIRNQGLKFYYQPISNIVATQYTVRIYIQYIEDKENGC